MTPQELKALLDQTTEGPWKADAFNNVWSNAPGRHSKVANLFDRPQADGYDKIPASEVAANARLIAMAPALARRVIAAENLVEALRDIKFIAGYERRENIMDAATDALAEWEAAQ